MFNFTLKEYNYFEAGEGKSALDSHFAHISHKIVRWVRIGNDLERGEQVADLIQVCRIRGLRTVKFCVPFCYLRFSEMKSNNC